MNVDCPVVPVVENPLDFMARSTPRLRAAVEQHQSTLSPADFADLMANIRSIFEKYTAKLLEFRPGAERGTALHQMMDQELKVVSQIPISCRRGCSGCCHY